MNLLPKSHQDFSAEDYWNKFFKQRTKAFEWYGEYAELCSLLHKYMRVSEKLLVVGCGNSRLSADLYDVGYHQNTNIDISDVVVRQMTGRYAIDRPGLAYFKMDMLQTTFADEEFSVILDKGSLDAVMTDDSAEAHDRTGRMFAEVARLLRAGGRYLCISLLQEHILRKILAWFSDNGFIIRIHHCEEVGRHLEKVLFPAFLVVCTKIRKLPGIKPILELALNADMDVIRANGPEEVVDTIKSRQQYAIVCHRLFMRKLHDEIVSLDLFDGSSPHPRYSLYVIDGDIPASRKLRFAIFIVPQGKETEWLYSKPEGQRQLLKCAGYERLVVVHLNRHHVFANLDEVKAELSSKVMDLAPHDLPAGTEVPFLSVDNSVSKREVRYRGTSLLSGEYVVEDVETDNPDTFCRRLIFLENENLVQSEARLRCVERRRKRKTNAEAPKYVVDYGFLACAHHAYMVAGLALQELKHFNSKIDILLVGLGGGGLASYIHHFLPKAYLDVVELDPDVVEVAKNWFGLCPDDRLNVHVADGIKFIHECHAGGRKYDVVMLDVDGKDPSIGMSCPPASFVSEEVLREISHLVEPSGVFVLNLVCRNSLLKKDVHQRLRAVFGARYSKQVPEEVNEVVYAFRALTYAESKQPTDGYPLRWKEELTNLVEAMRDSKDDGDLVCVEDMLSKLTFL